MKYSVSYLLFIFAIVCALLGLEWSETHGGPTIIPARDIIFAILLVSPLTNMGYALLRCRPRGKKDPAVS